VAGKCCGRLELRPAKVGGSENGRRAGKLKEFDLVMMPNLGRMYQFARSLTRSKEEAEDVVQEAFLRAWRFFHMFRRGSNAKAWLYRILYNVFVNSKKKAWRRELQMPEEDGMGDLLLYRDLMRKGGWKDPTDLSPERFDNMFGDEVKSALDVLPGKYRFPLLLCDVEGMDYGSIAKVVGCPIGTVRSRLSRGRSFLHKRLVQYARREGYLKEGKPS